MDMKSYFYSDMIWVVISSKPHSLRQMGKCEVFIASHFLQAIPVPIPIPIKLAQQFPFP